MICYNGINQTNLANTVMTLGGMHMVIGVCRIILSIDSAFSLKEKRHIVKSIMERLKSRYNASVAEVDLNDMWKNTVIGVACVSNEAGHADSIMSKVVKFVENDGRVVLIDYTTEKVFIK